MAFFGGGNAESLKETIDAFLSHRGEFLNQFTKFQKFLFDQCKKDVFAFVWKDLFEHLSIVIISIGKSEHQRNFTDVLNVFIRTPYMVKRLYAKNKTKIVSQCWSQVKVKGTFFSNTVRRKYLLNINIVQQVWIYLHVLQLSFCIHVFL